MRALISIFLPWMIPLVHFKIFSFILWTCIYWGLVFVGLLTGGIVSIAAHLLFIFMAFHFNRTMDTEKLINAVKDTR